MVCLVGSNSKMPITEGARMGGMGKSLHTVKPKDKDLRVEILHGEYVELDHYGRSGLPETVQQDGANRSGVATLRGKFLSLDIRSTGRKLRRKLSSLSLSCVTGRTVSRLARKIPCLDRAYLDGQADEESYSICGSQGFAMEEGWQNKVGEIKESGEVHDLMEPLSETQIPGDSGVKSVGLEAEVNQTLSQESRCREDQVLCNAPDRILLRGNRVEVAGSVPNEEDISSSDDSSKPNEGSCNVSRTHGDGSATSFSLLHSKGLDRTKAVTPDELETSSSSSSSSSPIAEEGPRALPHQRIRNVVNEKNDRVAQTRERVAFLRSYMSQNLPSLQSQANCNGAFESNSPVTEVHTLSEETAETTASLPSECEILNSHCSLEPKASSEKYEHELHSGFKLKSSAFTSKARIEQLAGNYGFKKAILETPPANHLSLSKERHENCDVAILDESFGIQVHETDSMEDIHVSSGEFSSDWLRFIEEPDEDEWDEFVDHYVDSKEFARSELRKLSPIGSDGNAADMFARVKTLATRFSIFFVLLNLHFVSMGLVME